MKVNRKYEYTLTREQAGELDRYAIGELGIKGLILMENAGIACAGEAVSMLGRTAGALVAVFCGGGNNGGDGFVVARHLSNKGADVRVFLASAAEKILERGGDAAVNLGIIRKMGLPVCEICDPVRVAAAAARCSDARLIIDALLGTGASGEVRGLMRSIISAVNGIKRPVLAVDLPSGLDCDTGSVLGCAVRCTRTVSFMGAKRGFENPESLPCTGEVKVADIGISGKFVWESRFG